MQTMRFLPNFLNFLQKLPKVFFKTQNFCQKLDTFAQKTQAFCQKNSSILPKKLKKIAKKTQWSGGFYHLRQPEIVTKKILV